MHSPGSIIHLDSWTEVLPLDALFDAGKPLEVDVGCGKGRFIIARAGSHPEVNYLGIDRLFRRLRKIDRKLDRAGLSNVKLLRMEASYAVSYLLPPASVSAFYIFFSDPWPKRRHHGRRLFSQAFLDSLDAAMVHGGKAHVATDHLDYFQEIRSLFEAHKGFTEAETFVPPEAERTDFELVFLQHEKQIGRASFRKQ